MAATDLDVGFDLRRVLLTAVRRPDYRLDLRKMRFLMYRKLVRHLLPELELLACLPLMAQNSLLRDMLRKPLVMLNRTVTYSDRYVSELGRLATKTYVRQTFADCQVRRQSIKKTTYSLSSKTLLRIAL